MAIRVNCIAKSEFLRLFYDRTDEFMERIHKPEIFIVKSFFDGDEILAMRNRVFEEGNKSEPSWKPLYDDCSDYHRIHDDYEKAYVKGKIHVFYHHGFEKKNAKLFQYFDEIFQMKRHLATDKENLATTRKPSEGIVGRVNFHLYPTGGGYQAEHKDPHGDQARIQTLVVASRYGADFKSGGLYAREKEGSPQNFVDSHTAPGDLIVLSPAIPHGVAPIDPGETINWKSSAGRWIILPLYVWSDYASSHPDNVKPVQVAS